MNLHSTQIIPMRCNWRIAIENALEDVHVAHVHKDSLAKLGLKLRDMNRCGKNSWALYDITDERSLKGLKAMSRFFEMSFPAQYFHSYHFPDLCISSVGGFTFAKQTYVPSEGDHTTMTTRLYSGLMKEEAPDLTWFFDRASAFNKQVFEEDARMCERAHLRALKEPVKPALRRLAWFTEALNES